jgi:hypothetical protein
MKFIVSGEGPSDIGKCNAGQPSCEGKSFVPGPMAMIIDKLVGQKVHYSVLDIDAMEFVSETQLIKKQKQEKSTGFPGKKRGFETAFFFRNARTLAKIAKEKNENDECPVCAVLFRDSDGTRSSERREFDKKRKSMEDGFAAENFELGVPMLPKPKSEAWLICALKSQPYQNCAELETHLHRNDHATHSAKDKLASKLSEHGKEIDDLAEMVRDGTIDPLRICMPSFNWFRERLEEVVGKMLAQSAPAAGGPTGNAGVLAGPLEKG